MIILKKADKFKEMLQKESKAGKTIGFVPTMGALHNGHLSLIKAAVKNNDITVCSIFVNPSQFNNAEDFKLYPNTLDKDIELLEPSGCNFLFIPSIEEIYPSNYQKRIYDLGVLETKLEGFYRPGHFQGVCQVVDQLLSIVQPKDLFLGQKDFQQCLVIKKLLQLTNRESSISIHIIATMREIDGLAMSSRNMRLNDNQRVRAITISKQLFFIKDHLRDKSVEQLKSTASLNLEQEGFKVDYIAIVNAITLEESMDSSAPMIALIAASIGNIRLIDNLLLN